MRTFCGALVFSICFVLAIGTVFQHSSERSAVLVNDSGVAAGISGNAAGEFSVADLSSRSVEGRIAFHRKMLEETMNLPPEERNMALCFAEDTPDEIVWMWTQAIYGDSLEYQLGQRWSGSQGSPITLRWSIVPDGTSWSGSTPSTLQANLNSDFDDPQDWQDAFQASFDRWEELTGITFVRIISHPDGISDDGAAYGAFGSGTRGDMRIGGRVIDGPGDTLAFNLFPSSLSGTGGDMTMDTSETWDSGGGNFRFFRNVIMHESGHGIGIQHVCPDENSKIMEPNITTAFDGPQHDDIQAGQRHYGDPNEPNDSTGQATDLGAIGPIETFTVEGVSTDDNSDSDYYRFETTGDNRLITLTLTPIGEQYLQGDETPACDVGAVFDSLVQSNLTLQLFDSSTALLDSVNDMPAGAAEMIVDFVAPTPDTYYARVLPDSSNTLQLYELDVTVSCEFPEFSSQPQPQLVCPGDTATFSVTSPNAESYQWRKNGGPLPGETSPTLMIEDVESVDAGQYTCSITNFCNTVVSSMASLTVRTDAAVTTQPTPFTEVAEGGTFNLFVSTLGSSPLTLQWQKDGVDIPGATSFFIVVSGVSCDDQGTYTLVATNPCHIAVSEDAEVVVTGCATGALLGDCDGDGDIDLVDFGEIQLCFTGPGGGPLGEECTCVDFDEDDDVDLVDFGEFQLAFTGPL